MAHKNKNRTKTIRVGYVLSYMMPNYVRTEVLLDMLSHEGVEVRTAINTRQGFLRYPETLWKLLVVRFRYHPDVYILGFRGQELFWPVRLLTVGKPLVFDEFLNMYLWAVEEHRLVKPSGPVAAFARLYTKLTYVASQKILSDTASHAAYSATLTKLPIAKFLPLYVGTNEALFSKKYVPHDDFTVFYYGSKFLPLHGVNVVVDAFSFLKDLPVKLVIIGGSQKSTSTLQFTQKVKELELESVVTHKLRVPYEELVNYSAQADICLGGPFGDTPQSDVVITGKTFQFLAMAKPVIVGQNAEATNAGFIDKHNCLLVERGNAKALAKAIRWAYEHQRKLPAIGQAGSELYARRFSVTTQAPQLTAMLRELL